MITSSFSPGPHCALGSHLNRGLTLWLQQKFTSPRRTPPYFPNIINKFPLKDLLFPPTEEFQGNIPPAFRDGSWKEQQRFCSALCRLQDCCAPSLPAQATLSSIRTATLQGYCTSLQSAHNWSPVHSEKGKNTGC